ncbi:MAG: hypothetical protein AAGF87_13230 [Bacteroidota bacterium]
MLESNDILDDGQASAQSGFDQLSASRFIKASGWMTFLGILFYILGGLFSLGFLFALFISGAVARGGGEIIIVILFFLVIVTATFIMGRQFQRLGSASKALQVGGVNRFKTDEICAALKGVFMTIGVFSLVIIVLFLLSAAFGGIF